MAAKIHVSTVTCYLLASRIDESQTDRVTLRWDATNAADGSDVNFAVTLFDSGQLEFHYGSGNTNLTPTVGISAGNQRVYQLAPHDGQAQLTDASSIRFALAPGFVDIGAYEFRGDSADSAPPTVVEITTDSRALADYGDAYPVNAIGIEFSEELNSVDVQAIGSFELRSSGPNGMFDDGDDIIYTLDAQSELGESSVSLLIADGLLPLGNYRLTAFGQVDHSIHDTAGLALDGNGDGHVSPVDAIQVINAILFGVETTEALEDLPVAAADISTDRIGSLQFPWPTSVARGFTERPHNEQRKSTAADVFSASRYELVEVNDAVFAEPVTPIITSNVDHMIKPTPGRYVADGDAEDIRENLDNKASLADFVIADW